MPSSTTPDMGLTLPTVSQEPGPTYATEINGDMSIIDSHDHSTGKGVAISNAGVSSSAAIARSKLAAGTANHVVINNASGVMTSEATLATTRGGTNLSSYTTGDLLYASGANVLSKLPIGSANQFLKVSGGIPSWGSAANTLATAAKTSNYSILSTDDVLTGDSTGGAFTFTLPDCASNPGKLYRIKKIDSTFATANAITIARAGSDTIQDATTAATSTTLNTQGEEIEIVSFGATVWQVVSRRIPSAWTTYALTIGAVTTPPTKGTVSPDRALWRRVGGDVELRYDLKQTVAGSDGSGTYLYPIPTGLTVDTNFISASTTNNVSVCGVGALSNAANGNSTNSELTHLYVYNTTNLIITFPGTSSNNLRDATSNHSSTAFGFANTNLVLTYSAKLPITGWNG